MKILTTSLSFGYEFRILPRFELIRVLRENLGDTQSIRTGRRVLDISNSPTGAIVQLENNECYFGDLIFGCDGAHSVVRNMICKQANRQVPRSITTEEKQCKTSLWIMAAAADEDWSSHVMLPRSGWDCSSYP